jgi:glycerophosphoryl diester phosphodiesterase
MQPFDPAPVVVGHRGAPRLAPENTPVSFAAAADAGAKWVELDVRRSADGMLVLHHDARLADGRAVCDLTADDLAAVGVWAFAAALDALPRGLGVDVEVKNTPGEPGYDEDDEIAVEVAEALRGRVGSRPLVVSSFNPFTVAVLADVLPTVPAGFIHGATTPLGDAVAVAREHGARVVCPQVGAPDLLDGGIDVALDAEMAVLVWTVDDPAQARRLVAAGAHAICTNEPGALSGLTEGAAAY